MALPDNRIRFPATKVDFAGTVGLTGLGHDNYPAPGQARYDWQRLYLIGLLANQSSFTPPTEYRDGTLWFDLNTLSLKVRLANAWHPLSDAVEVTDTSGQPTTLTDWNAAVNVLLAGSAPEVTFSGVSTAAGTTAIVIPTSLRTPLSADTHCYLWINGIMVDPRNCTMIGGAAPTAIELTNVVLNDGDRFTVILRNILPQYFYTTTVSVP